MPDGLVVEEFGFEIDVIICGNRTYHRNQLNSTDSIEEKITSKDELVAHFRHLIEEKNLPLESVASQMKLSLTTVRRWCRRVCQRRYASEQLKGHRVSRSSQVPFGWNSENGILKEHEPEMYWVRIAQELRRQGQSYRSIASHFQEQSVPTKNGGKWHAKTIVQVLAFNRRGSSKV